MADPTAKTESSSSSSVGSIVGIIFGLLILALYGGGAAKLSYDKYGSIGWALLAFLFAPIYYPIYAYFISSKSSMGLIGGIRKIKW